jgi:hypothetical protein
MGCVGVRRIFMAIAPERRAKRICALGVSVLVACGGALSLFAYAQIGPAGVTAVAWIATL